MTKRVEAVDITDIGLLSSNYVDISDYMPSKTPAKLQGTNEVQLYASYLGVLPLSNVAVQGDQNLLILNVYLMQRTYISDSKEYTLEKYIAIKISRVPDVEYIFISKEENILQVWIVINKLDRAVRDIIYDIEYSIIEHFRDIYFDFHVICRDDRDINEFFQAIMIYRKRL